MEVNRLIDAASSGDTRALGKLCSIIERSDATARIISAKLYPFGGSGWTTGITGAPGAGKSTLVAELVGVMLGETERAAILAVDPSSPLTGGAILGDRVRMGAHAGNSHIFIRSLASRGHLGGISTATPAMAACLEGLGFSEVLIETVGVGQSEVEIASSADTAVVVVTAGWGDAVQAAKAGFLEVADVFVVNKADRGGADAAAADIGSMLDVGPKRDWRPPVIQTIASEGTGIDDLWQAIRDHRNFLLDSDQLEVRRRLRAAHDLTMALRASIDRSLEPDEPASELLDAITTRRTDPWSAADRLLQSR
ncbi:MAG: methylmalonyl Co-A mutase-associated GTPase MeaB [Acidimicrobiia bacterium]|nr:MAG: methylmalonyl Co-A mutase-associated GTPase MeaB [Acidimicrobiia bacterium]